MNIFFQTEVNASISTVVDLATLSEEEQVALDEISDVFANVTDALSLVTTLTVDYYISTEDAQQLLDWTATIKVSNPQHHRDVWARPRMYPARAACMIRSEGYY